MLYLSLFILLCCIEAISLSVTDYSAVCLEDFWSVSKEEIFSLSWANRTDSLPCDLPVFILKLSRLLIFLLLLIIV